MIIGEKIKILLKEKNISQTQLAELIGKDRQGINKLLKSDNMGCQTLVKIASVLNVDISYFFNDSPNNIVNEPLSTYEVKPLFLEQRMAEVEKEIKQIKNKLKL